MKYLGQSVLQKVPQGWLPLSLTHQESTYLRDILNNIHIYSYYTIYNHYIIEEYIIKTYLWLRVSIVLVRNSRREFSNNLICSGSVLASNRYNEPYIAANLVGMCVDLRAVSTILCTFSSLPDSYKIQKQAIYYTVSSHSYI